MDRLLRGIVDPSGLTPHGFCLLWEPGLIWLHAVSDALVGLAYYSIPLAIIYFIRRRHDIVFGWVFWLFATFILACGTTHFLAILTLWQPAYWLEGIVKAITAILSVVTAVALWPLIPRALALPSPEALRLINQELAREIADRDRAEAALRVSEARLRQAQKMETIGQLTGGVAHDFNNLLTVMLGSLETMDRKLGKLAPDPEIAKIRKVGEFAMRAVERAATLTERLLAFSRQQPLAPRAIDPNKLVADLSEVLRRTLGETIRLETALADDICHTSADQNQLENALLNLAVNARDAMPEGGTLTIETANTLLDEDYVRDLDEPIDPGPYVMFAVSDNGTGMDPATLARAFEPFFTTKEIGRGTGLGLSQVYGFVRQSQGYVRLYSELGAGTTVKLYLPRLSGGAPDVRRSERPADIEHGRGEVVLLVEDDESLRVHGAATLRELGYVVVAAANGDEAIRLAEDRPHIDLLFTDIVLPGGMNGRELAEILLGRQPDLRVLYTSGYTQNAVIRNGQLEEGVELLTKPYSYAELSRRIRAVMDGRPKDETMS